MTKKSYFNNKKLKSFVGEVFFYIVLLALALVVLVPLYLIVINSLKNYTESAVVNLSLPKIPLFSNYLTVIQEGNVLSAMGNGLFIALSSTTFAIIFSSMSAFIITRRKSRITKFLYLFFISGMIAPLAIIPEFKILQVLNLSGTYFAIIFIHIANNVAFPTFLFAGFMKKIPKVIDESAFMDGCPPIRMFFQIILPMLKPVVFTSVILVFMGIWNDFQFSLYFITKTSMYTMPQTVYAFQGFHTAEYQMMCADLVLATIPVVILYLITQRFIVSGMTAGAVKG